METIEKRRETETFWRNHIVAFQESRQTKTAYAKAQGLKYTQFLYWFDKLTKGNIPGNALKWMPIKMTSKAPVLASVRMEGGYCVEIYDIHALAYLLRKK